MPFPQEEYTFQTIKQIILTNISQTEAIIVVSPGGIVTAHIIQKSIIDQKYPNSTLYAVSPQEE